MCMVKAQQICMRIRQSYFYLFAPATEHSGGQWEPRLSVLLRLVPSQCQTLEAPGRAPTGVTPTRGLTQDETSLKT